MWANQTKLTSQSISPWLLGVGVRSQPWPWSFGGSLGFEQMKSLYQFIMCMMHVCLCALYMKENPLDQSAIMLLRNHWRWGIKVCIVGASEANSLGLVATWWDLSDGHMLMLEGKPQPNGSIKGSLIELNTSYLNTLWPFTSVFIIKIIPKTCGLADQQDS